MISIAHVTVGPFVENTYLVADAGARRAVLVDPGDEPERILAMVERSGAQLEAIWLTHAHLDHIGAIEGIRRVLRVPVHLHPLDAEVYARASEAAAEYGVPFEQPGPPDLPLADGQVLTLGEHRFTVMHTPGHAPGHVMFVGDGVALGGDLLFLGSIGRTDLQYSNGDDMERSLARAMTLDGSTVVHPGHGPATTIAHELATNPFLNGTAYPLHR